MSQDVRLGLRDMNLVDELFPKEAPLASEVVLAKLEHQIETGSMPPLRYSLAHWGSRLSRKEKGELFAWIRQNRAKYYAIPGTPESLRSNGIRPIPAKLEVDPRRAELGRKLYEDKRLSGDDTLSCVSCHDLKKGGTDQEKVSTGIRGQKGGINAPTTFNAAFQFKQFWDGRAATLEEQAAGPPNNPVEMGSNWKQIIGKLQADSKFMNEFLEVYPTGWSERTITDAIASFERTLLTPNSRFDKYLAGDKLALSFAEQRGWEVFQKTGCATCHTGVLLGGRSFELMGRKDDYFKARGTPQTPADQGRISVTKQESDRFKFKVPTLRNIALTHPYFHDGSTRDLSEAVQVMAKYQIGKDLSEADRAAVADFLKSLTGEYQGKPL